MRSAHRVEGEHPGSVRALAEPIQPHRRLGIAEAGAVVVSGQRRFGRFEICSDHPPQISATQFLRPIRVRLVLQDLLGPERQRLGQATPGRFGRHAAGAIQQPIETVEINLSVFDREPVCATFGDDQFTRVDRHQGSPGGEQDLEDLLRPAPAEVTWSEGAVAMPHGDRSKERDRGRPARAQSAHRSLLAARQNRPRHSANAQIPLRPDP
jgi:hypothetical protein